MTAIQMEASNEQTRKATPYETIVFVVGQLQQCKEPGKNGIIPLSVKEILECLYEPYSDQFIVDTVKEITGQEIS